MAYALKPTPRLLAGAPRRAACGVPNSAAAARAGLAPTYPTLNMRLSESEPGWIVITFLGRMPQGLLPNCDVDC
jgi:hypothetical protein